MASQVTRAPAATVSATPTSAPPPAPAVLLVIGDAPNESEMLLLERLEALAASVVVSEDDDLDEADLDSPDVVVLSKTVDSVTVGGALRDVCAGVLFWEDNQQQVDRLSTITSGDLPDTAWHRPGTTVHLAPGAEEDLRAGLSGAVPLLTEETEVTYAPRLDGVSVLVPDAIRIGELGEVGADRWPLYALEAGARLADGTTAAGRRYFFGLYDDTFRLLTPEGLALFDAAVSWTAASSIQGACG